ncbi:MAG: hypothetical protein WKF37_11175 [Bryobacteraceae bacterium]
MSNPIFTSSMWRWKFLPSREASEDVVASWSRDGRWIYFASNRDGAWQVWKTSPSGGVATRVTQAGGFAAFESPDGRYLYYAKGRSVAGLWRVPVAGGREESMMEQLKPGYWGYWGICDQASSCRQACRSDPGISIPLRSSEPDFN